MDVARTVVVMVLSIVVPLLVQRWDKKRLDEEQRARSWNFASWACALYAFGPLSMLGWFWVTRRGWRRAWGLPAVVVIVLILGLVDVALELVLTGKALV